MILPGPLLLLLAVLLVLSVAQGRSQQDYREPTDDSNSPSYRLTDEQLPPYFLLPKRLPVSDQDLAAAVAAADVKEIPSAQLLQHGEQKVTIRSNEFADRQFIAIVAGCSTLAAFLIVSTGYCVYRVHQNQWMTQDVDYPAYGVTGPVKNAMGSPPADRKLAQSAQMYHFQHQKQQMIAVEKNNETGTLPSPANRRGSHSEAESDDEDKDYTVYECPGLAPGGQMEVRNPMFNEMKPSK